MNKRVNRLFTAVLISGTVVLGSTISSLPLGFDEYGRINKTVLTSL